MSKTDNVRRHHDGSIDFDFYRASAAALRRQAIRDAGALRMQSSRALVMAGALGFAVVIPSNSEPAGPAMARAAASWTL